MAHVLPSPTLQEWRKKYRKYKPIDQPKKCSTCHEKKVKAAYHVICGDCAKTRNVCPKCLESKDIVGAVEPADAEVREQIELLRSHKGALPGLTERERRGLLRQLEREADTTDGAPAAGGGDSDEESIDAGADGGGGGGGAGGDSDDEFISAMLAGATERARAALRGVGRAGAAADAGVVATAAAVVAEVPGAASGAVAGGGGDAGEDEEEEGSETGGGDDEEEEEAEGGVAAPPASTGVDGPGSTRETPSG